MVVIMEPLYWGGGWFQDKVGTGNFFLEWDRGRTKVKKHET